MLTRLALAAMLLAAVVSPTQAQTDYYARLGLTYSSKLLQDQVIQEVETQQSLAPTLAVGVSIPIAPTFTAGLEGAFTSSGYHSSEQNVETDLGTVRTGSLLLNLAGPIVSQLSWRVGGGLIGYWPAENEGIFLQGGSTRFLAGGGVDFRPRLLSKWDLMASLRYDFHRFTTDELKARGFTGSQGVQRLSASIGLARAGR